MSAESTTLFFAQNADSAVDAMLVEANQDGRPMFLLEEDNRGFISGELLIYVYASLAFMGATKQPFGEVELSNTSYLLAALEARSRGARLYDEMVAKITSDKEGN